MHGGNEKSNPSPSLPFYLHLKYTNSKNTLYEYSSIISLIVVYFIVI